MKFSSPFLGTFFQYNGDVMKRKGGRKVFVPFLGDFLSIKREYHDSRKHFGSFRPLSWGLSFNIYQGRGASHVFSVFSSPFLGTFFQFGPTTITWNSFPFSSPFLGTFFQSRACEAPARLLSQAHSRRGWGNRFIRHSPSEMKCRFSQAGRASAGICNEKIEMRNEKWWCGA